MRRTTNRRARSRLPRAFLIVAVACAISLPTAWADGEALATLRHGGCSGPSNWKLGIRRVDRDTLRVRLVVAGGRADSVWRVFMDHDGFLLLASRKTTGLEGSFSIRRRFPDDLGVDVVTFGAREVATQQHCRGRASF